MGCVSYTRAAGFDPKCQCTMGKVRVATVRESQLDDESDNRPTNEAEDVYAEFCRRRDAGEEVDLERVCDDNPELALALRALHSLCDDGSTQPVSAGTRTFDASRAETEFGRALSDVPRTEQNVGPLHPGERVGVYEIGSVLGEGGFAVVYRATQLEPVRRTVALKAIKLGLDTKEVLARFEAERQALAILNHSHVAKVFDAGVTTAGRPYFVMEYVDGKPLTTYCDEQRLSVEARLRLFLRVCEAVQHAHRCAIIHRDLKPSNVLVTVEGDVAIPKIIDFGIAKATGPEIEDARPGENSDRDAGGSSSGEHSAQVSTDAMTQAGQVIGTPEYMSPEQAAGEPIDTRTDIYALGCILYELVCGARPFEPSRLRGVGLAGVLQIVREEEPPRPSARFSGLGHDSAELAARRGASSTQLRRRLQGDLDWITMKALAKEPDRRYGSAGEFAADVQRHLALEPVVAGPPSVSYKLRKFVSRHRRALIGAVVAVVFASGVGAVVLRVTEERHEAERLANATKVYEAGERLSAESRDVLTQLAAQEEAYETARDRLPGWLPIWEREEELAAWSKMNALKSRLEDRYSQAFLSYTHALGDVPSGSDLWRDSLLALQELYDGIQARGNISLGTVLLKQQIQSTLLGGDGSAERVFGSARSEFALSSEPSGATVYCFRFEHSEQRLLPLAYDVSSEKVVGKPFLRVERVWNEGLAVLGAGGADASGGRSGSWLPGDRLLAVDGQDVPTRSALARALSGVAADAAVSVAIFRDGARQQFDWVPFPASFYDESAKRNHLEPGRLVSVRDQLGITFEGYPLEFVAAHQMGETREGEPLRVSLPRGSYLLVLRREGFAETRWPLYVRGARRLADTVRLVQQRDVPEGFVYVPRGPTVLGGKDGEYLQNVEYEEERRGGFFIGRYEVTFDDYAKFLAACAGPDGRATPRTEEVRQELVKLARARGWDAVPESIQLHPRATSGKSLAKVTGPRPLLGITYLAAVEYAHWRSQEEGRRYRLPTDHEWEQAARGADARTYVWGDYLVWSYCWSMNGNHRAPPKFAPRNVGASPLDESVYGVRDMEGAVDEFTSGRPKSSSRFVARRGGAWETVDAYELRVDARVGFPPDNRSQRTGFRVVCELEVD